MSMERRGQLDSPSVRIARMTALAAEVFGNTEKALAWLQSPHPGSALRSHVTALLRLRYRPGGATAGLYASSVGLGFKGSKVLLIGQLQCLVYEVVREVIVLCSQCIDLFPYRSDHSEMFCMEKNADRADNI